jgi:hypothetical protein
MEGLYHVQKTTVSTVVTATTARVEEAEDAEAVVECHHHGLALPREDAAVVSRVGAAVVEE